MTGGFYGSYGYNRAGYRASEAGKELGLGGVSLRIPPDANHVSPADVRPIRETEVAQPSDMIAIGDADLRDLVWMGAQGPRFYGTVDLCDAPFDPGVLLEIGGLRFPSPPDTLALNSLAWMRRRHGGTWNVAFCDAHAERLKTADLFNYRREPLLRRWNRDHLPHSENVAGLP
jgi:prepilin-type processing-associated H-X9-DG protein